MTFAFYNSDLQLSVKPAKCKFGLVTILYTTPTHSGRTTSKQLLYGLINGTDLEFQFEINF